MLKLGVLGSGKGSNLQAVLEAIDGGRLAAEVVCVISDVEEAFILERARERGIPAFHVDGAPFRTKLDGTGEAKVVSLLRRHKAELVVLAGFMRMVKQGLIKAFPGRILNIHPSLLPAFPGLVSWEQALTYGAKVSGCTVHFVDEGMDTGPIVAQRAVPILDADTPESLHQRIQEQEHEAYPEVISWVSEGRVRVEGRRVRLLEKS